MVLEDSECSAFDLEITEDAVETPFGRVHCTMKGVAKGNRPTILTFHDIGLNHKTCFESLFVHQDMHEIMQHFAVCHVDAPGQQDDASTFSTEFTYPSMDQLEETLPMVLNHFGLRSVAGMGVGAGANILTRFALKHPDLVEGLVLINMSAQAEGFLDWAVQKITGWTHALTDTVISHIFGKEEIQNNPDQIATFRHLITNNMNQSNLQQFVKSYKSRRDIEIERPVQGGNVNVRTLKCPVLLIVGDNSPAVDAVVDSNSRMNPTTTTFLKMADCGGLPQVDQPGKLVEAFKYFLQGMGYMPSAGLTRLVRSRTGSSSSIDRSRNRCGTNTSQGQRGRSHTDVSMDSTSNSIEHNPSGPILSVK
ncbi:protein NDRG1b isoform X1 [Triplophysa rosa]|uniref:Protein NDRG2 n=1 Tax=Triplophysa rosa TaxID=992332 RepID=A0A9W7WQ04_TRIRA|nr:protein NDRG1b isoform X1 [Triplophysa rosa]KAI7806208.1 protein NDRG1 [Triplophysa rosa]